MKLSTAQRLAALNQRFYAEHAENFADSRPRLAAGVQRVLARVPAGARVLEVGCGDGKVGRALARAGVGTYVGLDSSEAMLDRAKRYTTKDEGRKTNGRTGFVFLLSDLTAPAWSGVIADWSFDWILAFAVFHHLPGYDLRAGVLRVLAAHLAPAGRIVLSNWQFTRSERARKRIVPWAEAGLSEVEVEPGDYLLSWERRGTRGLRYVHLLNGPEVETMAGEAGLHVLETFSADGMTGDLSDYSILQHGN